jgi:hypothetical protein
MANRTSPIYRLNKLHRRKKHLQTQVTAHGGPHGQSSHAFEELDALVWAIGVLELYVDALKIPFKPEFHNVPDVRAYIRHNDECSVCQKAVLGLLTDKSVEEIDKHRCPHGIILLRKATARVTTMEKQ